MYWYSSKYILGARGSMHWYQVRVLGEGSSMYIPVSGKGSSKCWARVLELCSKYWARVPLPLLFSLSLVVYCVPPQL